MPLNLFYTMVQKKSKMTKNSNQGGGPALTRLLTITMPEYPECVVHRTTNPVRPNQFLISNSQQILTQERKGPSSRRSLLLLRRHTPPLPPARRRPTRPMHGNKSKDAGKRAREARRLTQTRRQSELKGAARIKKSVLYKRD